MFLKMYLTIKYSVTQLNEYIYFDVDYISEILSFLSVKTYRTEINIKIINPKVEKISLLNFKLFSIRHVFMGITNP